MAEAELNSVRLECLQHMLRPIIRFLLGSGHTIHELVESAKAVLVEMAEQELRKTTSKVNISRLSMMTGLHRNEIAKRLSKEDNPAPSFAVGLATRVLGQWENDSKYCIRPGKPKILSYHGEDSEFWELVEGISRTINPGTVLFELERKGLVKKTARGLQVVRQAHDLRGDFRKGFQLLARDVNSLMRAAEENITGQPEIRNLHARTEYDNVFLSDIPRIRKWLFEEGLMFHRKFRDFVSACDADITPDPARTGGGRVVLGTFSFTEPGSEPHKAISSPVEESPDDLE